MHSNPALFDVETSVVTPGSDDGVAAVETWFRSQPSMIVRFARALRQSLDEVLDGQRTGRFDVAALEKTEKTYLGTKVEIVVRADFGLERGSKMDFRVAGHDVDAKFTIGTTWTIPREAMGHICLLMTADDRRSRFRVGLLRVAEGLLNKGTNQDGKRTVSVEGRSAICWLVPEAALPENVLLQLPTADRDAIFCASDGYRGNGNGGQLRINELLRRVHGRIIDRTTAVTVASQLDGPKRMRDARKHLRREGIVVLGHQDNHPLVADALGLPIPDKGSWVAARLVRQVVGDERRSVSINGLSYVIAQSGEPKEPAPPAY